MGSGICCILHTCTCGCSSSLVKTYMFANAVADRRDVQVKGQEAQDAYVTSLVASLPPFHQRILQYCLYVFRQVLTLPACIHHIFFSALSLYR